jgi:hypothetical protein
MGADWDLGELCCFIGGAISEEIYVFVDAWMHGNCARFASRICLFVSGDKMEYSGRPVPGGRRGGICRAAIRPSHVFFDEGWDDRLHAGEKWGRV